MNSFDDRPKLLESASELYAMLVTAQAAHRRQLRSWHRLSLGLRWLNVLLAALTTAAIVITAVPTAIPYTLPHTMLAAVIFSFLTLGILLAEVGFDASRHEEEHRFAVRELGSQRGRFLLALQRVAAPSTPLNEARLEIEALNREVALTTGLLREPGPNAYRRAHMAVRRGEESALSREEVDRLLPEALRSELSHKFALHDHGNPPIVERTVETQPLNRETGS